MKWTEKKWNLPGLEVKNGKISKIIGIKNQGKQWIFENDDPQIYIKFERPICGIRIMCDMKVDKFKEWKADLFYRRDNEDYSEENCCKLSMVSGEKKIWEIRFDFPVYHVRFDPLDFSSHSKVESISIQAIGERDFIVQSLERDLKQANQPKAVILTHDMSMTGAPLLAYHIARGMKESGVHVVTLTRQWGDGFLENKYRKNKVPVLNIVKHTENEIGYIDTLHNHTVPEDYPTFTEDVIHALGEGGYKVVIGNTVVSGEYAALFKKYGFRIITLIHEMKTAIKFYGFIEYGNNIAKYSDLIVFPNRYVMQDFEELFPEIYGKCMIQAQGVYMKEYAAEEPQSLEKYGIGKDDYMIMSSGTCELRKGIDLFINAAMILGSHKNTRNIHYVWTGNFNNEELKCWLINQIERCGLEKYIHFIPFIKDSQEYSVLLKRADVFWALSREDPFPSTVLEAMKNSIPVVGFRGSGGIETMLSENRGLLVDGFNLARIAEITESVFENKFDYKGMLKDAKKYVDSMGFDSYIQFLSECAFTDKWMDTEKDKYILNDRIHYYKRQLREKSIKDKIEGLDFAIKRKKLFCLEKKINIVQEAVLLDTAEGTDNIGDEIIMDYCGKVCRNVLPKTTFHHIPTHIYVPRAEEIKDYIKILCGTNLIYTQMENSRQWAMPQDISNYRNICLLGVGMQQIGIELAMSDYTKKLLKFMLSTEYLHSVRDEETKKRLAEIGIKNVINTGCPTTWGLTEKHCAKISCSKSNAVLATVTDYLPHPKRDKELLETLKKHYDTVYIWVQGQKDYEYLQKLVNIDEYRLIPPSLKELDFILKSENLDYVGTRLHAGIRSLNYGHRTVIISIDNRARAMAKDINLPIMERESLEHELEKWIYGEQKICIRLPKENIQRWKKQFSH